MLRIKREDRQALLDPMFRAGRGFYLLIGVLILIMVWGLVMYIRQVVFGLGLTGMDRPAYWGLYMVNFIFFIGISHAGTLISAILRVTQAEWRRPITRIAEAITAFALVVGTLQILFDLGRPDRLLYLFRFGRLQSPLLWDAVAVTAYFLGSLTYLYLPIIPDAALLRDNLPAGVRAWRRRLYTIMALGWRGNRTQWLRLEKTIAVMAVLIIPVAVSVHTVISWILATTVQPGWHSTVFGPYFVVGAIFSGIGALFIAMTAVRRVMHLEAYITERQYRNLGYIFITMSAIWFYFTYAEHMTLAAGQLEAEFPVLASKLWGPFSFSFWSMVVIMVVAFVVLVFPQLTPSSWQRLRVFRPRFALSSGVVSLAAILLLQIPQALGVTAGVLPGLPTTALRLVAGTFGIGALLSILPWLKSHIVDAMVIASGFVVVGMWLERWNIVVPTMVHPRLMPVSWYTPTLTEWSLFAASVALFVFLFVIFFKLFPAVSVWEVREGRVIDDSQASARSPMPEPSLPSGGMQPAFGDNEPTY
ncbi:MAG: polysulfide reductase NrfD [Chloroflexi bacterium]|nr:polysulfide reductase NrfD [Chloroflexota bacterium]